MSDILIKGMEMPKDGENLYMMAFSDGKACASYKPFEWHEVVLVQPPMRLIDANGKTFPTPHRNPSNEYMKGWNACLRSVQQQPTVIPADEDE